MNYQSIQAFLRKPLVDFILSTRYLFFSFAAFGNGCASYRDNQMDFAWLWMTFSMVSLAAFILCPKVLFWVRLIVRCFLGRL